MTKSLPLSLRRYAPEGQPDRGDLIPLSGWLMTALVSLEEDAPGALLHAFKSKGLWRNAVAVAVATGALDRPGGFLLRALGELDDSAAAPSLRVQFSRAIRTMSPQQIVAAALVDEVPSLMGSLRKIGSEPLNTAEAYRRLIDLLGSTTPEGRARRRVLEQVNSCRLTDNLLEVIETLDLAILTPTVAPHINGSGVALRLNASLGVIRQMCSGGTDAELRKSADALGSRFNAGQFARSWLSKADRLEPLGIPIDGATDLVRINPAKSEEWGRRFRNCIAGYANEMAAGATAFFSVEGLSVIVVLRLTDIGWMLTGVHGHANSRVSRQVLEAVKERLSPLGVLCALPARPTGSLALVTGVFSRIDDLEFFDGMDTED